MRPPRNSRLNAWYNGNLPTRMTRRLTTSWLPLPTFPASVSLLVRTLAIYKRGGGELKTHPILARLGGSTPIGLLGDINRYYISVSPLLKIGRIFTTERTILLVYIDIRSINLRRLRVRNGQWGLLHIVLDSAPANRAMVRTPKYILCIIHGAASLNASSIVIHIELNWPPIRWNIEGFYISLFLCGVAIRPVLRGTDLSRDNLTVLRNRNLVLAARLLILMAPWILALISAWPRVFTTAELLVCIPYSMIAYLSHAM